MNSNSTYQILLTVTEKAYRGVCLALLQHEHEDMSKKFIVGPIVNALANVENQTGTLSWKHVAYDDNARLAQLMFGTLYMFEVLAVRVQTSLATLGFYSTALMDTLSRKVYWSELNLSQGERIAIISKFSEKWIDEAIPELQLKLSALAQNFVYEQLKAQVPADLCPGIMEYLVSSSSSADDRVNLERRNCNASENDECHEIRDPESRVGDSRCVQR